MWIRTAWVSRRARARCLGRDDPAADCRLPAAARPKAKLVITNLSSTALLEDVVGCTGAKCLRVPVGRQATIDALAGYRSEQIALAGEGTGAVMMSQFEFVYDGIASMLAILSLIVERGRSLGEILAGYPEILHAERRRLR